mmetsp:Transcript_72908/g.126456  ORF Transcript_72908/g.126456 Transcript_72908/m.126456 type:complete len:109 (+) Transcript_72908:1-327(+)
MCFFCKFEILANCVADNSKRISAYCKLSQRCLRTMKMRCMDPCGPANLTSLRIASRTIEKETLARFSAYCMLSQKCLRNIKKKTAWLHRNLQIANPRELLHGRFKKRG